MVEPVSVNKDKLRVRKSTVDDGAPGSEVRFTIESEYRYPVAIRLSDAVPEELDASDIEFSTDDEGGRWRRSGSKVEFSRIVSPEDVLTTKYSVADPGRDAQEFSVSPVIESVSPVDPEDAEDGNDIPTWRGRSARAAPAHVSTQGNNEESRGRTVARSDATSALLPADSEATPALSVIMPTLDEEQGVRECIERIKRAVETLGISAEVIISDSSTDRTPEIAQELGAIVLEPDEKGYGYAYRYAFEHARGQYIAIGDADTTYDFRDLPRLLDPVAFGSADMAMGDRLGGSIESGAMPALHQYVGNPLLTKFLNVFYGAGVNDSHSGFRVISRDALDRLELTSDGMEFASEMIMKAGAEGLLIEEVPITYHEREGEATLSSFRDGWRHIKFMLTNAPGWLFSTPGLILGVVGTLLMTVSLFDVTPGAVVFGVHSMIAGSLLTIVGHQALYLGVFATVAGNPISRPRDRVTAWIIERIDAERGTVLGLSVATMGSVYAVYLLARWVSSGFTELPLVESDIAAFTAIVLGVQTVFYSLFRDVIGDR